jgi:hypothetical protein
MFETLSEIVRICGSRLVYILNPNPSTTVCPGPVLLQGQPLRQPHREGRRHQAGGLGHDGQAGPGLKAVEDQIPFLQGHQHRKPSGRQG